MIERQFLIFKTANQYNKAVARGDIKPTSIAFVVEDGTIRTHGFTFGSKGEADKKHAFITQEAYDALEEYDENTIYFILEPGEMILRHHQFQVGYSMVTSLLYLVDNG